MQMRDSQLYKSIETVRLNDREYRAAAEKAELIAGAVLWLLNSVRLLTPKASHEPGLKSRRHVDEAT
jgi:hypothetical protein